LKIKVSGFRCSAAGGSENAGKKNEGIRNSGIAELREQGI